jgi:hypothetical protein
VRARHLLVLLAVLAVSGCASLTDRAIIMVGGPERGFLTPAMLTDAGSATPVHTTVNGCTASGCAQAPGFCAVRGYQPGTDAFHRCVLSVEQNLRNARR